MAVAPYRAERARRDYMAQAASPRPRPRPLLPLSPLPLTLSLSLPAPEVVAANPTLTLTLTLTANPNQAAVLTDDFETARPLRTKTALRPATPARPPARPPASSDRAVVDLLGNERSASELLIGADARTLPVSRAALEGGEAGADVRRARVRRPTDGRRMATDGEWLKRQEGGRPGSPLPLVDGLPELKHSDEAAVEADVGADVEADVEAAVEADVEADVRREQPTRGGGATRVTARVRERRDEQESRERQRVNLYVRADEDDDGDRGREDAPISDAPLRR